MLSPTQQGNHAVFTLEANQTEAEQEISIINNEIKHLHGMAIASDPHVRPEFDVILADAAGNVQKKMHVKIGEVDRFGESVDLRLPDSRYKIHLENVRGAKSIDIFAD
jgi:hypothetical protein